MSTSGFRLRVRGLDYPILSAIVLWVLTFIATPIVGKLGGMALQRMILLGVLTQVAAVIVILVRSVGLSRTALIVIPVLLVAWLAEFVGSQTGFPFGSYSYTEILQPQLGRVPLLIPLAWLMMIPPSWAAASLIVNPLSGSLSWPGRVTRSLVAAIAFTAWDLYLDPQMVGWNFWQWKTPGVYFGIPLQNFAGWLLVAFIIALIFQPDEIQVGPLMIIYCITWLLQFIGQLLFWRLPGPAFFGFLAMGAMVLFSYLRNNR